MNEIKEEDINACLNKYSSSSINEKSNENEEPLQIKRRVNKLQTLKTDKTNVELMFNKVNKNKQKRLSISLPHRMKSITLSFMNSSKQVRTIKKQNESIINNIGISKIIDPSYNFYVSYELKDTALKMFQAGFEEDQTKIKFFCNYLYQLVPFNKIFSKLSKSKDPLDNTKLEKILYNLAVKLKYEFIEKNKVVYMHGNDPDKFYIILKGEVDIIIPNEMEVMMNEYEYYYYILRLYKFQEHSLLEKVLNKNYDNFRLDKKLLEDWIQTGFNTLVNLERESEMNKDRRKKKNIKTYNPAYTNTEELINHLEKNKKLNLLLLSQNVILLLEKIRIRNEKARDAKRNKTLFKKRERKKKNKINKEDNLKPKVSYVKINGQLKKIFIDEEQIEVVEKCANEISQLIEMGSENFNFQKFLNQLNKCDPEKYMNRVKPYFFDEDANEKLDPEPFILFKNDNKRIYNKKNDEEDENDISLKLKTLFGLNKDVDERQREPPNNRKKTIVYNYVLVNTNVTGESFGEMIYEKNRQDMIIPRIATVISKENCHFATLKKELYNKLLKEFNENNLYRQFLFLYSLDIFKDCNQNKFMKNMSFFIKRTIRANEILFNQDDNLGDNRSIYFVASGSFISYCYISINDIEILFKNMNYGCLIPPDDAYEDNLFNKENHYFCQFKKKKIFFNLFNFSKRDIIGYDDALYNNKYIYTVKCQSSNALVYEIKLKFLNLIINSEVKLDQIFEKYEAIKRNLLLKFFLNAFNNKTNFYKFISFDDFQGEKEEKKFVHKNYFGKNPFVDERKVNERKNNKQTLKLLKTVNKVNDNIVGLMPELKKVDIITNNSKLNNLKRLTKKTFINNNKSTLKINRNKSTKRILLLSSNKSMNKLFGSSRNIKHLMRLNTEKLTRTLKKKLSGIYSQEKPKKLKIDDFNCKSSSKMNLFPQIMNTLSNYTNTLDLKNKEERFHTEFKDNIDINDKRKKNYFKSKTMFKCNNKETNKNNEYIFGSNLLSQCNKKEKLINSKSFRNNLNNKCYNMDNDKNNGTIKLKNYLKNIPDFFENNRNSKKIFFGMNNKALYQNKRLFTDF